MTTLHPDATAALEQVARVRAEGEATVAMMQDRLDIARTALADIRDADCDPDGPCGDLAWCKSRAAAALIALFAEGQERNSAAPAPPTPETVRDADAELRALYEQGQRDGRDAVRGMLMHIAAAARRAAARVGGPAYAAMSWFADELEAGK